MSMESQVSFLPNTREMTPVGGQQTHFASSREMLAFIWLPDIFPTSSLSSVLGICTTWDLNILYWLGSGQTLVQQGDCTWPGTFMHWDAEIKLYDACHVPQNDSGIGVRGRQGFQMNQDWRRVHSCYCTRYFFHCWGWTPDGTQLEEGTFLTAVAELLMGHNLRKRKFILAHSLRWGGTATGGEAAADHVAAAVGKQRDEYWFLGFLRF